MIVRVDTETAAQAGAVHAAAWRASHAQLCSRPFLERHTPERQTAYLRGKMAGGSTLFLLLDGGPVGVVSVRGSVIEDLYVLPERQRCGYGTQLLRHAMAQCCAYPTLWCLSSNTDAIRLYKRSGFAPTGRRHRLSACLDEIEFALQTS